MTILLTQAERLFEALESALSAAGISYQRQRDHDEDGHPRLIVYGLKPAWADTDTGRYGIALVALTDVLAVAVLELAEPGNKNRIVTYHAGLTHELVDALYAFKRNSPIRSKVLPPHAYRVVAETLRKWHKDEHPNDKKKRQKKRRKADAKAK
ncbi:MAG: hypothetical protein GC134_03085 [Proteobacteria bacterium]|nr:hypothetical protein [Pseudomonadota bacterium]